jgi:hypothetical protein
VQSSGTATSRLMSGQLQQVEVMLGGISELIVEGGPGGGSLWRVVQPRAPARRGCAAARGGRHQNGTHPRTTRSLACSRGTASPCRRGFGGESGAIEAAADLSARGSDPFPPAHVAGACGMCLCTHGRVIHTHTSNVIRGGGGFTAASPEWGCAHRARAGAAVHSMLCSSCERCSQEASVLSPCRDEHQRHRRWSVQRHLHPGCVAAAA